MNEYITETKTDSICDEHIKSIYIVLTVTKVSDGATMQAWISQVDLMMVVDESA